MKMAKIAELKNGLSRYLHHVREGGEVLVVDRDQPIARIVSLQHGRAAESEDEAEWLTRLERRGLVRPGAGGLPDWLDRQPARIKGSVLKDLLAERKGGW